MSRILILLAVVYLQSTECLFTNSRSGHFRRSIGHVNLTQLNNVLESFPSRRLMDCAVFCSINISCLAWIFSEYGCILLDWFVTLDKVPDPINLYFERALELGLVSAEQSSTMNMDYASNAIDGKTFINDQCPYQTHSLGNDYAPWWMVDLKNPHLIIKVRFVGAKTNHFISRLHDIHIRTGMTSGTTDTCGFFKGPPQPKEWITVLCQPYTVGQFVKLQKEYSTTEPYLEFCEVEVVALAI